VAGEEAVDVRRDYARPIALALNVIFAVLLTALETLLLVVGGVGLLGRGDAAQRSDAADTAYALAILGGVVGVALFPAVVLLVSGVGRYMRGESARRLRAADLGLVVAYVLVTLWFGPVRLPIFVHALGVTALAALVALQLDIRSSAASSDTREPEGEIRTAGGGWRARRRR
jgi:hypothetical protein